MRQYTSQTVKRNLFAAMLLAPFIPVVLALGTGGFLYWQTLQQTQFDQLALTATCYAKLTDNYLEGCLADLQLLEKHILANPKTPDLRTALLALQSVHKDFVDLALIDLDGAVLAYAGPFVFKGSHISPGKWFNEAIERGQSISDVQTGLMGVPHFLVAHRIDTEDGAMILRVAVDPVGLNASFTSLRDMPGDILLTSRDGAVIAGSGGQVLTQDRVLSKPLFLERVGSVFVDSESETVYASHQLRTVNWILAVRAQVSTPLKNDTAIYFFFGLFIVIGGIIVLLSSLYLSGYVEKMLRQRDGEREKLREQLYRAGRLAELGEMAAGFAHEINNPLQIMKSDQAYIEMVLQDFKGHCGENSECISDIEEIQASVGQIKLQIDRCARITHSILRFGRAGNVEVQNLDLVKFIPEVVSMVQKKAHLSNIALHVNIGAAKLLVHADPGRLQQVLLNLLNNAIYAVQEANDGRAGEIHLSCVQEQSGRVKIQIADNGIGISPENQKLIFTPFFTTKPPGSGTGLGLSVCHGIVDSMNGVLDFVSVRGEGTTFSISLPRVSSN